MNVIRQAENRANAVQKVSRNAIVSLLDETLRTAEIADHSINGLQVEGVDEITKIGLAVDASLEVYKLAQQNGCQMVIVHHGIIWDGIKRITGPVYRQIEFLVKNGVNLYASHLPLDLHPTLGNNALIAKAIGLKNIKPFGLYNNTHIGFEGRFTRAATVESISVLVKEKFGGSVLSLPFGPQEIWSAAVISGGGSSVLKEAIEKKMDLFLTGEPSHENHHAALEGNLNVIYGGHYHTEKPGVQAIGEFLNKNFNVATVFLDVPTLV